MGNKRQRNETKRRARYVRTHHRTEMVLGSDEIVVQIPISLRMLMGVGRNGRGLL